MPFITSKKLFNIKIETPKDHSYFLYFILESNEGLCFYSTEDSQIGQETRIVDICCPSEWKDSLMKILDLLNQEIPLKKIYQELITDSF